MRFSNFLFPQARRLRFAGSSTDTEARLTDALGFDTIWFSEQFSTASSLMSTRLPRGGAGGGDGTGADLLAVAQMALHHPDPAGGAGGVGHHISKGRLIVGLGRGTAYNIYDYQGYGIDHTEAQARFEEAEAIMFEAWKGEPLDFHGRFFHIRLPELRPAVLTKPHPYVIRAAATEHGMLEIARRGNPFMMNVQSNAVTSARIVLYLDTLRAIGLDEATVAAKLDECWVWRNVYVAETDAEAEQIAVPAFVAMHEHRVAMRNRIYAEQKASILPMPPPGEAPPAHASAEHALVYSSPATVAEKLAPLKATGAGGLIMQFRLGPMNLEQTAASLRLFADKVIPAL